MAWLLMKHRYGVCPGLRGTQHMNSTMTHNKKPPEQQLDLSLSGGFHYVLMQSIIGTGTVLHGRPF
ncbi:hypothetical protein ACQKLN_09780 [Paenibacillus glucanolyticus]|uniref:hypothetical protein n=1 Tax=Paenibacillus glucanolyticus TaxID=59843 RepID=UPI003CFDADCC